MLLTTATEYAPSGNKQLLAQAVSTTDDTRTDAILDKLFTYLFSGLVYPQIWEDPEVDMAAMELRPSHHIVAISSGGCNVMSYLTMSPARISAVDLNASHVALVRLKLAAFKSIADWGSMFKFIGEANSPENVLTYDTLIRPMLDASTRRYWDSKSLLGKRRINGFAGNFYMTGLLGRFIGAGHFVARLFGTELRPLLAAKTLAEQAKYFETKIAPLFRNRLVRWLTSNKVALFGLGIPPKQYEALCGSHEMADVLCERLRVLACGFLVKDNYFAWQAFARRYQGSQEGSMPPYLAEKHFQTVRSQVGNVTIDHMSITEKLKRLGAQSCDRIVLLDAQDWMNGRQLNELWLAITQAARPGSRVIFRTAGEETILPGRISADVLRRWLYLQQRSRDLGKLDRSAIYGGFHIYELAADA